MKDVEIFVGIDVGKFGAISVFNVPRNELKVITIPNKVEDISDYFDSLKKFSPHILACIEQVSLWDGDLAEKGKVFRTAKMVKGYNEMTTILRLCRINHVRPTPREWQSYLNLKVKEKETYYWRKKRFYDSARYYFRTGNFTKDQGDAVLLMYFLMKKYEYEKDWIEVRIPKNVMNI